jgi:predicted PurR-regulated permease PerM
MPPRVQGLLVLSGFALVTAVLYLAKPVLMPVALAVVLAFLFNPLVRAVERVIPRGLAVMLVVIVAFTAIGGASYVIASQIGALAEELPKYRDNIRKRFADVRGVTRGGAIDQLKSTARDVMEEFDRAAPGQPRKPREERVVVEAVEPRSVLSLPAKVAPAAEMAVQGALVIALVGFLLYRRQDMRNRLIRLVGENRLTLATKAIDEASERIGNYLVTLSVVNAVFGTLVGVGLMLIGLPYALLWGVIAATFRFIPYVGVWVAALLPLALALAFFDDWVGAVLVAALFAVLEPLIFLVLEPLVYHRRVGVSDVGLLVAVAFWTWLWGAVGLVLAVPLTVCVVVLGKYVPPLRFMAVLLGDETTVDRALACYQCLLAGDVDDASEIVEQALDRQRPHAIYDDVLVPALAYARREHAWERISDEERGAFVRSFREVLETIAVPPAAPGADARRVVGCPIRDVLDELGFVMLRQLLDPAEWNLEIASADMLSSEMVALAGERKPVAVCVGSIGLGGLARTRYLTKRLRGVLPEAHVVVARWGVPMLTADDRTILEEAGANAIGTTLIETREQLRHAAQSAPAEAPQAAA